MDCPKCGHDYGQNCPIGDECPKCGFLISKYEQLIAVLDDEDFNLRANAIAELTAIFEVPAVESIRDTRAIELLITALNDESSHVRESSVDALIQIGEPAIEPLIVALKDEDHHIRESAIYALGRIGNARAVEPIITALKDKNWYMRCSAVDALKAIDDVRAIEPLIEMLRDKNFNVQKSAVDALGVMGDARAAESLIEMLKDKHPDAKENVVEALIQIGAPSVEYLVAALESAPTEQAQLKVGSADRIAGLDIGATKESITSNSVVEKAKQIKGAEMDNKTFTLRVLLILSLATILYCLYLYLNPYTFKTAGRNLYKIDRISGQVWQADTYDGKFVTLNWPGDSTVDTVFKISIIVFLACIISMNLEKSRRLWLKFKNRWLKNCNASSKMEFFFMTVGAIFVGVILLIVVAVGFSK